jgi:hypothetical protein
MQQVPWAGALTATRLNGRLHRKLAANYHRPVLKSILLQLEIVLGGVVGFAAIWVWYKRTILEPRRARRAPVKTDLLRPPGHSLAERLDENCLDAFLPCAAVIGAGFTLVHALRGLVVMLWIVWRLTRNWEISDAEPSSFWEIPSAASTAAWTGIFGVFGLAVGYWGFWRLRAIFRQAYIVRMGLRGEQAVAEELQRAVRKGYHVFHDLPKDDGANIDHVVVGRGGVFAIETKARSKDADRTKSDEERVVFDGTRITFGRSASSVAPVQQAEGNARWLAKLLSESTGTVVSVSAVIAVPGWWCEPNAFPNVRVRNPAYFAKELSDSPRVLADDQIQRIVHQLDQRCRDVSF